MKHRYAYQYLLILLSLLSASVGARAQSIITNALSTSAVCPGGTLTVSFSTTGTFGSGNVFAAQLSDPTGAFGASPTVIGTLTGSPSSGTATANHSITATISPGVAAGTGYNVRVVATTPSVIGTTSPTTLTINPTPGLPSVSNPAPYCENDTSQPLSATPTTGATLNWFRNGTALPGAPTPSTGQSGTTVYTVSQTLNGCTGGSATITVTVNNRPVAPSVTSPQSACQGDTPRPLTATLTDGGTSLNWYTTPTGGVGASVAPVPPTSTTGTTNFYVSQSQGSCESARATLEFRVIGKPDAPTATPPAPFCQGASPARLTATASAGATLLWYGTNATGGTPSFAAPVPNNQTSATYYVSQAIGSCESARTLISVTVVASPANPAVTTPAPFCAGATAPVLSATADAGNTLQWWGTAASGGAPSPNPPAVDNQTSATYYVSQVTPQGCSSGRQGIVVTVTPTPGAPTNLAQAPFCLGGSSRSLTATAAPGATLTWFDTNGAALPSAPTPPTSATGSFTYQVSQTLNGCPGPKANVVVTVNPIPAGPTAPTPAPFCQNAPVGPLTATGQNLLWYSTNATGGTGSANAPVPNNQTSATYYVSQTVNGCESARTPISVTVIAQPAKPTAATPAAVCSGDAVGTLSATPDAGNTLRWYGTAASGGTPSPNPPVVSNTATATYYVSQVTPQGCESDRLGITQTIKAHPAGPAVAGGPIIFCQNRSAQPLTATAVPGATLTWYGTSVTGGTGSSAAPTPPTNTVGPSTYYVSQTVNGCESATRSAITVQVNAIPTAPAFTAPAPYCQGTPPSALMASGTQLRWYGTDSTSAGSGNATVPATNAVGTFNYYVTQTVNGCESNKQAIPVRIKPTPTAPGTSALAFCQNTPAPVLTASLVTNATANWYGTSPSSGTASGAPPSVDNTTVGTTTYYVSQSLDGCEGPRAGLSVRVKPTPAAPGVSSVSFCNNAPATALTAAGSNITWYDAANNKLPNAPTPNTTTVGSQTFAATQTSSESCESPKAPLVVTIKPLPPAPVVSNLTYCQAQLDQPAQNVQPLTAVGQNIQWYYPDGTPTAAPTPPIDRAQVITYTATQTVNGCTGGPASLQVTIQTTPAPSVAKSLVTYCRDATATSLVATATPGGTLFWIDPYNNVTQQAPTPYTLNTTPAGGVSFYVYQQGANGCYSARSAIKLIVTTVPTLSLSGSTTVSLGQTVPLRLTFTSDPPYSYSITGGYAGVANRSDTIINVLPRGNTTYQVLNVSNGCGTGLPGNPATATVTVLVPTITTNALASTTLCAGTSFTVPFTTTGTFTPGNQFAADLISVSDTTKKFTNLSVATNSATAPLLINLPANQPGGQYYVRVRASNPGVALTGTNSPTTLTVRALPTATLIGTQNTYEGTPANLTLTLGGDGPWTITYADSVRSYSATATSSPYVVEVRPSRTTTYRLTSVANGCGTGALSGTAVVTVLPLLGIEDQSLNPLVNAYPVPTGATLTVVIDVPLSREPATLILTDLRGQAVLRQTTRVRQTDLDLSRQPAGTYLLRIQVGDRQATRKVLKL